MSFIASSLFEDTQGGSHLPLNATSTFYQCVLGIVLGKKKGLQPFLL